MSDKGTILAVDDTPESLNLKPALRHECSSPDDWRIAFAPDNCARFRWS